MNWSLFVTNVGYKVWPAEVIAKVYQLRWRIETLSKLGRAICDCANSACHSADLDSPFGLSKTALLFAHDSMF